LKEGDRQAPEGFYTVSRAQLNPNSRWHRSFNLGFPNLYDRTHGRTGSFLMVHGGCSSIGCYAMTDRVVGEIWDLINAAFDGGQDRFAVHVFPFHLTDARLDAYKDHQWAGFWRELKPGYDAFEETQVPPIISVCRGRYAVQNGTLTTKQVPELSPFCPSVETAAHG
jgi:murein L,D-transpeptidase YafK